MADGDINGEFSYGTYDVWLEAGLMSDVWEASDGAVVSSADVDAETSGNKLTGTAVNAIAKGEFIKVTGFANDANNGVFYVDDDGSDEITVVGSADLVDEDDATVSILRGNAGSNSITNGTTERTFHIQRQYTDIDDTFSLFTGMGVESIGLSIPTNGICTCSFGFVGKDEASKTVTAIEEPTVATSTEVLSSVDDVKWVLENNAVFAVVSADLSITNNIRPRLEVGSIGPKELAYGRVEVSGSITAYFADNTVFDKWLNQTDSSLSLSFQDSAGNAYVIELPRVRYSDGIRAAEGTNTDVIMRLPFEAYMKAGDDEYTIRVHRFAT